MLGQAGPPHPTCCTSSPTRGVSLRRKRATYLCHTPPQREDFLGQARPLRHDECLNLTPGVVGRKELPVEGRSAEEARGGPRVPENTAVDNA